MVKTTRESENLRWITRFTRSTSFTLREEQVVVVRKTCPSRPTKGATLEAVDPTVRPKSKLKVPLQKPVLNAGGYLGLSNTLVVCFPVQRLIDKTSPV